MPNKFEVKKGKLLLYIHFALFQVFVGNHDRYTPAVHDLKLPIITRYIRIHPETWQTHISMRAEFYGCREGENNRFSFSV